MTRQEQKYHKTIRMVEKRYAAKIVSRESNPVKVSLKFESADSAWSAFWLARGYYSETAFWGGSATIDIYSPE